MSDQEPSFSIVRVECYAGYRGEETPRRFYVGDQSIEVGSVIDRWLAPEHRCFKLQDIEGNQYILRHDIEAQHWELTSKTEEGQK